MDQLLSNNNQTAVVGARGYAGQELARILLAHPRLGGLPPVFCGRERDSLATVHPALRSLASAEALTVQPFAWSLLEERGVDTVFLATPHEQSRQWVPEALARGFRVIDLSGAWRLESNQYRAVYGFEDNEAEAALATQQQAVYGMPELHREAIAKARLVANPGCYATSVILALKPLVAAGLLDLDHGIICDAKSGVSGAGREPTAKTHYMYAADNLSVYGLWKHRHTGELFEQLGVSEEQLVLTPHLLPIPRGILSTIYVRFRERVTLAQVQDCFRSFYAGRRLVRLFESPDLPQIQYVERTNFCDLGVSLAADGRRGIVVACLDNLLKGAASQAVQNWNLMCGWPETEGLL
ncbi:N-acetyl-gamma-glutamyl-phosphate reductase [Acidipila sp. EB88]|uniref:N-acetyl-gamma-glutamyl-phosphate reductase n=1 Tax=Acidipila sp. EB88 TaxID=2305226 RepID=UPI000F5E0DD0|nr:N-acetyl-gamma-glutamyl-phosphate reductase [Acidipila sp. EB88]RRA49745.1 N-acetyl-gamma-glutamyl-phosphate reductase [Acidipila sp. EB88]